MLSSEYNYKSNEPILLTERSPSVVLHGGNELNIDDLTGPMDVILKRFLNKQNKHTFII